MKIDYRYVQTRLRELGFNPGPVDGVRGPLTDAAVVAFKRSVGLRARPYIGPITMEAMRSLPMAEPTSIPWMSEAAKMRGLHEQRDVSQIRQWFDRSVSWIDPREIPWCGAFVATCYRKWDKDVRLPDNPLGARRWGQFGKSTHPVFGALLVFWRIRPTHWAGHVGFYHGEDDTHFHVLGGNQRNAVTVTRIDKSRLLASRWPAGQKVTGQQVFLMPDGIPMTINEA